jgi:multiple sugar transport system substrate-binding protein
MNRKSFGPILLTAAFALAASFSATPTHAADVVTINYWHTHSAPEEAQLNKLIAMFEQDNPNIKIQETAYAYNDFQKALLTSIAGGQAPDAVRMDIVWVPQFAQQGALLQLDSAMSDFKTISGGTFPGALATNAWNGKYWGLPLDTNTQVLLWNQKVFQAAGITAAPSTVQEFADDACKLTTKVNGTQQYGYAMGGTYFWAVAPLFYSMGAKIVDDKMTTATGYINGKESVAVFQMLVDLYNKGCLSPNLLGGGIGTEQGHGTGAYAMIIDGPWMVDLYKQDFPTFQPAFAPVPAGVGTNNSSVVGGEDVVVSASTQHQAETLAWVRFLMSQKAQTFMGQVGIVPTLSALTGSKDLPAYYQVFMTQLQTAQARLPHPKWGAMDDAINAAFTKMLKGDAKVQDALDQAATTINGLLAVK